MATITNKDLEQIIKFVQVGELLLPIVVTTVAQLKAIFGGTEIDPAIFAKIDALCADRIALSDAEAAAHGHPRRTT